MSNVFSTISTIYIHPFSHDILSYSWFVPEITSKSTTITVSEINFIAVDGNTIVYIQSSDKKYYKQAFYDNESLITVKSGDTLEITYDEQYNEKEIIPLMTAIKTVVKE